jgi:3-phenylpropionate/trans-cinnamate dioxygenase ferredoxin subunit
MCPADERFFFTEKIVTVYNWTVADIGLLQLADDVITETKAGTRTVALLKKNGQVAAFAALCPHAGARLCEGWLDPLGRIVCPLHKYRFDPATGRNTSGEGYKLFKYPVELRENEIWIGLRD